MKQWFHSVATVALVGAAVVLAIGGYQDRRARDAAPPARAELILDWRTYTDGRHTVGPEDAVVTLTEFSDFQCPACAQNAKVLKEVLVKHPSVRRVYRHLPLTAIHPEAQAAARASECAARQGRFWEMHNVLYERQEELGQLRWAEFARLAGIGDAVAFDGCHRRAQVDSLIESDAVAARRLGATATPTMLVNDVLITGVPGRLFLDSLLTHLTLGRTSGHVTPEQEKKP